LKKAVVIGSGFAGMSAACFLAKDGWDVTVLEKNSSPGGRARQLKEAGFTFDMGPSWYWMPGVFEHFFGSFGKNVADYYQLKKLDPSYRVYWSDHASDIPSDYFALKNLFEKMEPGSSDALEKFINEAAHKYDVGINQLVYKPSHSLTEYADWKLLKGIFKLDVFTSMRKHINKYFKNPQLRQLLEFPVLFLGALPQNIPALYSLMNYADIKLGTWYPQGGMYKIVEGMYSLAKDLHVNFLFDHTVSEIKVEGGNAKCVIANTLTGSVSFDADVVIGAADYHFIETRLLATNNRSYSDDYWKSRVMSPSCLIYFIGLRKKLNNITHHSLFFDTDFELHGNEIYKNPQWPNEPLFYVSVTSVTDDSVAPAGCENLFFLVPVAAGLQGDSEQLREQYFDMIVKRFEKRIGQSVTDAIIYKKTYSLSNFADDYNSYKGNAYGLANTLLQTAVFKPRMRSKKVKNLFYAGQLTVPGPGVPPALISGELVAKEVIKYFNK
jgi:phytoene desaturase